MAPPEQRSSGERPSSTVYYNMKTSRPQPPTTKSFSSYSNTVAHARSQSSATRPSNKASSPMASPRGPLVTEYPAKLSPSASTPRHSNLLSTPVSQLNPSAARTPSPNYFGLQVESSVDANESGAIPRQNWTPSTSSVKSFGAAIPQQLPLDANPEFEAFRRQADANRGKTGFNLSNFNSGTPLALSGVPGRPKASRWHTSGDLTYIDGPGSIPLARTGSLPLEAVKVKPGPAEKMEIDADASSQHDSAYVSSDSKPSSEASFNPPGFINLNLPRRASPAQFESPFEKRSSLSRVDDRHPRLSMVQGKADPPSPDPTHAIKTRSDTAPVPSEAAGPAMLSPTQLKEMLESPSRADVLLLDLRVSPQYAQSRIKGALNLCIPTTLLKRATFNLQKLEQTFQGEQDKEAFSRWRETKYLVVYDAFSSEKRDAVSAMNTIKKFTNEAYTGSCSILRGGFNAFAAAYPTLIDHGSTAKQQSGRPSLTLAGAGASSGDRPSVAPVVGGVMLPASGNNSNAFFSNIRQNQDLVDGVGQMDVTVPEGTDVEALPLWLRDAANTQDHGKKVSDKFLGIEVEEQTRMKVAYSYINPTSASKSARESHQKVQLSGIEKGVKNRYKDILPFEHARVKLEGKPEGTCDYINASHIKASRSHKRYIASQGPLPATFEDFWSVIWDQDVRVIVMLTAESEGGQLKCHPYWKDREFGPLKLRALSEKKVSLDIDRQGTHTTVETEDNSSTVVGQQEDVFGFGAAMANAELGRRRANTTTTLEASPQSQAQAKAKVQSGETPYVIIRKFALSHGAHPFAPIREITHLHYPSWPDFGTPAQPSHLLALVELANVMQRASLPVDIPGALATASQSTAPKQKLSPSPKKRSRTSSNLPLAWWEQPETELATHPMLVHCSAGCGRTGTFCTVDAVIDMLKRQRIRNIKKANDNIERKVRGPKMQAQEPPQQGADTEGDISMAGLSFAATFNNNASASLHPSRGNPFDDMVSPGTKSPVSPVFPTRNTTAMSISPSPSPSCSDDDDDAHLDTSWLDDDSLDLISATVHDFRGQRLSMVQTLRQYVLCYETVIEWVWRLQERGGPAGSAVGAPGTGAGGTAAMRARGRSGTVAHVAPMHK